MTTLIVRVIFFLGGGGFLCHILSDDSDSCILQKTDKGFLRHTTAHCIAYFGAYF